MLAGKTLLDYTILLSCNDYKQNDKIIYKYFKDKYVKSSSYTERKNETINYLLDEIKHDDLMSEKHEKKSTYLNYVKNLLILASTITGCISISIFASLVAVPVGIASSTVGIRICAITAEIKKYKSIIKKMKKDYKIVLLRKANLHRIEDTMRSKNK